MRQALEQHTNSGRGEWIGKTDQFVKIHPAILKNYKERFDFDRDRGRFHDIDQADHIWVAQTSQD